MPTKRGKAVGCQSVQGSPVKGVFLTKEMNGYERIVIVSCKDVCGKTIFLVVAFCTKETGLLMLIGSRKNFHFKYLAVHGHGESKSHGTVVHYDSLAPSTSDLSVSVSTAAVSTTRPTTEATTACTADRANVMSSSEQ